MFPEIEMSTESNGLAPMAPIENGRWFGAAARGFTQNSMVNGAVPRLAADCGTSRYCREVRAGRVRISQMDSSRGR